MKATCIAVMLLGLACDPLAKPSDRQGEALSKEFESCATSSDCRAPLRCADQVCQNPATSRLGSYYWAAGRLGVSRKSYNDATVAFQQAVGQFEAEKLTAPPGLLCDYGAALRLTRGDPKAGEQAARVLHRCLLGAVPGSATYWQALDELAQLEEQGLDPALLARDKPADTYLTRPGRAPSFDSVKVTVDKSDPARNRGYDAFAAAMGAEDLGSALSSCYSAYWEAARKDTLVVEIGANFKATYDDFEDEYFGGTLELTPTTTSGPEGTAASCVKDKLEPIAAAFGKKQTTSGWKGAYKLTIAAK